MDNSHNGFDGLKMVVKNNERTILWVLIAVVVTFVFVKGCSKTPPNAELAVAKEQIKNIEAKRVADSITNDKFLKLKDENISILQQKENVIVNQYIQSNDKVKNIPAIINALIRDSLRAAVNRHAMLSDRDNP